MNLPVIAIGAGGHGTVVIDALLAAGRQMLDLTDPMPEGHGRLPCNLPVLRDDAALGQYDPEQVELANGLGCLGKGLMPLRRRAEEQLETRGWRFCSVVHPTAIVTPFATLEGAVQLMAGCVVQAGATVGSGTIVNTADVVERDQ
jgi:hypothetical protein